MDQVWAEHPDPHKEQIDSFWPSVLSVYAEVKRQVKERAIHYSQSLRGRHFAAYLLRAPNLTQEKCFLTKKMLLKIHQAILFTVNKDSSEYEM